MRDSIRTLMDNLHSDFPDIKNDAYTNLIKLTDEPVDWAYEIWDELLILLKDKSNHVRSIAAQVLSNLAKSDPENRMFNDLDQLMEGTYDEKFVTARHTLESLWKVGAAKPELQKVLAEKLTERFQKAEHEKNGTLVRYDIIKVLRRVFDQVPNEEIMKAALGLIQTEADLKYRKKYADLWKDLTRYLNGLNQPLSI